MHGAVCRYLAGSHSVGTRFPVHDVHLTAMMSIKVEPTGSEVKDNVSPQPVPPQLTKPCTALPIVLSLSVERCADLLKLACARVPSRVRCQYSW